MLINYKNLISSIIVFHRKFYDESAEHSLAFASAVVTVTVGFAMIAASMRIVEVGLATSDEIRLSKLSSLGLFFTIYLVQFAYLAYYGRSKVMLAKFEALSPIRRKIVNIFTVSTILGVLVWMFAEFFVL